MFNCHLNRCFISSTHATRRGKTHINHLHSTESNTEKHNVVLISWRLGGEEQEPERKYSVNIAFCYATFYVTSWDSSGDLLSTTACLCSTIIIYVIALLIRPLSEVWQNSPNSNRISAGRGRTKSRTTREPIDHRFKHTIHHCQCHNAVSEECGHWTGPSSCPFPSLLCVFPSRFRRTFNVFIKIFAIIQLEIIILQSVFVGTLFQFHFNYYFLPLDQHEHAASYLYCITGQLPAWTALDRNLVVPFNPVQSVDNFRDSASSFSSSSHSIGISPQSTIDDHHSSVAIMTYDRAWTWIRNSDRVVVVFQCNKFQDKK